MTLRVYIIDEHPQVRKNLVRRLSASKGIVVIGESGDVPVALEEILSLEPDVVLLEVKMKRADGVDVCSRIARINDRIKVAVLTSYIDADEFRRTRQAGAAAYLLKGLDVAGLARELRTLVAGKVAPSVAGSVAGSVDGNVGLACKVG